MEEKLNKDSNNKKKNNIKKYIIIVGIIVILIIIGIVIYARCLRDNCANNTNSNDSFYYNSQQPKIDKPLIYLYPTEETKIHVELGYSDKIKYSYPQYTTGWNVLAKKNGDLIDLDTGRNLYSLYYESEVVNKFKIENNGFIVKGTEIAEFLEEKLAILGLTEREAEECIVYWLPELQRNEYNYIRFATKEEINANMPLYFSVEPDTIIRVLITFKGLDKPIDVKEQQLETPERTGFVVVEWGGTEIN